MEEWAGGTSNREMTSELDLKDEMEPARGRGSGKRKSQCACILKPLAESNRKPKRNVT